MSYIDEVVKEEYRALVSNNPKLKQTALFIYKMGKSAVLIDYGKLKKQFNKYLEILSKG